MQPIELDKIRLNQLRKARFAAIRLASLRRSLYL